MTDPGDHSQLLNPLVEDGYYSQPIPSDRDHQIRASVRSVRDSKTFDAFLVAMPHRAWQVLTLFAERMAALAVRRRDVDDLRVGLIAVQLALASTDDEREVIPVLSLLYRAGELINADPTVEFRRVASLSADQNGALSTFPSRNTRDRSIEAVAYIERNDADGFRFERTW
jgi:hypothetical protein